MSVGAIGGAGAAGASGGAAAGSAGAGAAGGSVGAGNSPSGGAGVEGVGSSQSSESSSKSTDDKGIGNTYNISQVQNNSMFSNMSTQDSMELHNCASGVESSSESSGIDLKKLMEMIIAIKLLEAMNENQGSGGGFSAIG